MRVMWVMRSSKSQMLPFCNHAISNKSGLRQRLAGPAARPPTQNLTRVGSRCSYVSRHHMAGS